MLWLAVGGIATAQFSGEEKQQALVLVGRLSSESFADREAAMQQLESLPASALPWLEEMIGGTGLADIDLRSRLKSIARSLKKRSSEESLRSGTQVKIDLEDAGPAEVLEALKTSVGRSLTGSNAHKIWKGGGEQEFSFEGSFWGAVEAMVDAFPPIGGGRENLGADYRIGRWGDTDFQVAGHPSVNSGILRVRHARMALENSGGKDFLAVTLVPNIEPGYQVEGLALLVNGLTLEDGTVLEPEKKVKSWKAQNRGTRYSPGGIFTWIFPLGKGAVLGGSAGIEGAAEIIVRRHSWTEIELPEDLDEAVPISASVNVKVLERAEGRLKIQFEGSGSEPACFDDYELRQEAYQVLDKDGNVLKFSVRSSSSGGGDGWRNSYGGKIYGEPARLRASLPGGEQKVELKFEMQALPMPGSSLAE